MCVISSIFVIPALALAQPGANQSQISESKEAVRTIESQRGMTTSNFSLNPEEPGGISLTRLTNQKADVMKLIVKSVGQYGTEETTYYFTNGEPLAIVKASNYRTFIRGLDDSGAQKMKDVASLRELHFSGEKCLLHLLKEAESPIKGAAEALLATKEAVTVNDEERETLYLKNARDFAKINSQDALETHLKP